MHAIHSLKKLEKHWLNTDGMQISSNDSRNFTLLIPTKYQPLSSTQLPGYQHNYLQDLQESHFRLDGFPSVIQI